MSKFVQIVTGQSPKEYGHTLYALDEDGVVYWFNNNAKASSWIMLPHTIAEEEKRPPFA